MSAHTPGPWSLSYSSYESDVKRWYVVAEDGNPIARVMDNGPDPSFGLHEFEGNSKLLVAAPELYAALVNARSFIATDRASLVECCTGPDGEVDEYDASAIATYDELLAQIDASIAKADGL